VVALPESVSKTVAAIDAAIEADQEGRHGYRIPAGGAGNACDRKLWYDFRWATMPEVFDAQKLRIFETGKVYETRLLAYLRKSGQEVVEFDGAKDDGTPKQIGISFARGHGFGYLDAETFNVPEAPTVWHVAELKSHKAKSYAYLLSQGVQKSKPEHFAQFQLYMHKRGRSRAQYVAVNKDTDEIKTWRFDYDFEFCAQLEARCERIAFSDWAPPRISEKPINFPCGFCRHADKCHGTEWPEINCRTCLHADVRDEGVWHCVRHAVDLSREDQNRGCGSHLFLPDLVPGEQIDANEAGEWVDYILHDDGKRWRDEAGDKA
jgi:hypothetical protein